MNVLLEKSATCANFLTDFGLHGRLCGLVLFNTERMLNYSHACVLIFSHNQPSLIFMIVNFTIVKTEAAHLHIWLLLKYEPALHRRPVMNLESKFVQSM